MFKLMFNIEAFEGNSDICFNLDMRSEISLSKGQILYSTYTGCLK